MGKELVKRIKMELPKGLFLDGRIFDFVFTTGNVWVKNFDVIFDHRYLVFYGDEPEREIVTFRVIVTYDEGERGLFTHERFIAVEELIYRVSFDIDVNERINVTDDVVLDVLYWTDNASSQILVFTEEEYRKYLRLIENLDDGEGRQGRWVTVA